MCSWIWIPKHGVLFETNIAGASTFFDRWCKIKILKTRNYFVFGDTYWIQTHRNGISKTYRRTKPTAHNTVNFTLKIIKLWNDSILKFEHLFGFTQLLMTQLVSGTLHLNNKIDRFASSDCNEEFINVYWFWRICWNERHLTCVVWIFLWNCSFTWALWGRSLKCGDRKWNCDKVTQASFLEQHTYVIRYRQILFVLDVHV